MEELDHSFIWLFDNSMCLFHFDSVFIPMKEDWNIQVWVWQQYDSITHESDMLKAHEQINQLIGCIYRLGLS